MGCLLYAKERSLEDYEIPGYSIHSVNLECNDGGRGIAVYTHNSLDKSIVHTQPELAYQEACLLEIKLRGGDLMLFGCFYRSPTTSITSDKNNESLNQLLRCLSKISNTHTCLVGDFNFRNINWLSRTPPPPPHNVDSKETKFIEAVQDCYLHQHMEVPTRRRGNDDPSLIDLVFSDEGMQVSDVSYHSPLGKSDHSVITFNFNCYLDYSSDKDKFIYDKADYDAMRIDLLRSNWEYGYLSSVNDKTVEDLWLSLKSKPMGLRKRFVPKKKYSGKPKWTVRVTFPVSKSIQEAIRNKQKQHRQWMAKEGGVEADLARLTYTKASNKVKSMIR